MQRRLIDRDSQSGIAEYHHYDPSADRTVIETVQDVAPILELRCGPAHSRCAASVRARSTDYSRVM